MSRTTRWTIALILYSLLFGVLAFLANKLFGQTAGLVTLAAGVLLIMLYILWLLWHSSETAQTIANFLSLGAMFVLNFVANPWKDIKFMAGYVLGALIVWYIVYNLTVKRNKWFKMPTLLAFVFVGVGLYLINRLFGYAYGTRDIVTIYGPAWAVAGEWFVRIFAAASALYFAFPRLVKAVFGIH